ncbi:MAG: hypothetical protein AAFV25_01160 [Bacteroidota bacterium]
MACILLLFGNISWAQSASADRSYDRLLEQLEQSARSGQKRALRDLGSLLHKAELRDRIVEVLHKQTFLKAEEFDFTAAFSKEEFMAFYYEKADQLEFSPLLEAFYLSPLNEHKVAYKTVPVNNADEQKGNQLLRQQIQNITQLLDAKQYVDLPREIDSLARLEKDEGHSFLLELLLDERLGKAKEAEKKAIYLSVAEALVNHPEMESVRAMFMLIGEELIPTRKAVGLMARLTNVHLPLVTDPTDLVGQYEQLMDSLGDLEIVRQHGYERLFPFQSSFFHEQVDYYGKILNESAAYPWIQHNALVDLINTEHPRSLFYLASQIYKLRNNSSNAAREWTQLYRKSLLQLTQLSIGIELTKGEYLYDPYEHASAEIQRKLMVYWTRHYEDYEWDDNYLCFTNKYQAEEITQNYERLFRRLNSRNDSVAMLSFVQLTEGEPGKVMELAQKYRQLLRTYNSSLPSFKHKYLEGLVQLTHYCKRNSIPFKLPAGLQELANKLLKNCSPNDRYTLENQLIQELRLNQLTALEYMACLNESNEPFSFSVGRILDHFYSKHWTEILQDDLQLRLYLKKSQLFESIGVYGSCNYYLVKFDMADPELQSRLNRLGRVESDEGILNQMMQLVVEEDVEESFGLADFLSDPTIFDKHDINILPAPESADIDAIFQQITREEDPSVIRQLYYYLRLHPSIEMVPHLFSLIDDLRILVKRPDMEVTVADFNIPIIEEVYDYSFPPPEDAPFATDQWRELWKKDKDNFLHWRQKFYEERLEKVLASEQIKVEVMNELMDTPFFGPTYKKQCLEVLHKIEPAKNIKRLLFEPKLSVAEDLVYFDDFFFSYKELDDIVKLFDINNQNASLMLDYIREKVQKFSVTEKGSFYNNLFRQSWLANFFGSGKCQPELLAHVREALEIYLDESDYLSEYEEQTTNLHIAQIDNIGLSVFAKLQSSLQYDLDEASKNKIQQTILAGVSYGELGEVALLLSDLSQGNGKSPFDFLHKDFGLPIYQLDGVDALHEFIDKHKELSEYDFYFYYLRKFGVELMAADGKSLDYQKIYDMLQFDIVTPFVSRTGGKRDYFSYGIIKLLELKFNDRLGFHEKLNENQTFYRFSSAKRATAWRKYLLDRQLVNPSTSFPPSFSQIRQDEQ